jgi:hypothetical protein
MLTLKDQKGTVIVLFALTLTVILGFTALAIDIGDLYVRRNELQNAADAAALAGALLLPDTTAAGYRAIEVANKNMSGNVLNPGDIRFGKWNFITRTLDSGTPADAIECITRRSINHYYAGVLGVSQSDVSALATAIAIQPPGTGNCWNNGVEACGEVGMGQGIQLDEYCVYGKEGVTVGQGPHLINGSLLGALKEGSILTGQGPECDAGRWVDCLFYGPLEEECRLAYNVMDLINDIKRRTYRPPGIKNVVEVDSLPSSLSNGTAYIVNGNVNIGQGYRVNNVIIAALGNVNWGQGGSVINTGSPTSSPAIGIFATGNMNFGQGARVKGAHLIVGGNLKIGQGILGLDASIQVAGDAYFGQGPNFDSTWPGFDAIDWGSETGSNLVVKLVD